MIGVRMPEYILTELSTSRIFERSPETRKQAQFGRLTPRLEITSFGQEYVFSSVLCVENIITFGEITLKIQRAFDDLVS